MQLIEAIENRRSIHDFKRVLVDEAVMKEIFRLASWAPNHRLKQPWEVMMFQNDGVRDYADLVIESYLREGFAEGYDSAKTDKMMQGIIQFLIDIPHHALIYMERDSDFHKFEEDYASVCAFIQNAQLAAWEKGIGVLWTTSPYIHDVDFIEGIGLNPELHKVAGVLQMGYPARVPKPKPRSPVDITFRNDSFNKKSDAR
ncbi:nitroreductase [Halobacillus shinanisalinarum]|uniref:Nitroreductase n=1 Tax=Halobacillus shinanisalinarum TaxID=2932258 RepID=A0ABY4H1Q5_9BACI|nr:nitroreductase [Halobacillus shinanisalinarum]UOQ94328.1 nitroreductase [Halobacillus shinanisalinarum]